MINIINIFILQNRYNPCLSIYIYIYLNRKLSKGESDMEKENELKSESNFLKKFDLSISNWFDDRIKLAIICCFIFGILVHFTFLSEILLSQDGIWNSLDAKSPYDWEISLGRWGIMFVDRIANYLSIPNITGIISLLLVTISTISIINLLNIKSKPGIILTSFAMMASPALATTMIYAFTSISYCMALLLASISARLMFTEKFKIISRILSSILIAHQFVRQPLKLLLFLSSSVHVSIL